MGRVTPPQEIALAGIRIDTHVAVWLYTRELERVSDRAVELLELHPVVASPMVRLELAYLHEVGRIRVAADEIIGDLANRVSLAESDSSLPSVVDAAESLDWTRDPFDRLIVADAVVAGAALLTADSQIRDRVALAVW